MTDQKKIGAVILAAGSSSRMGSPKQLLPYREKTLLQRVVDITASFNVDPALLVLGAHAEEIREVTDLTSVTPVINRNWSAGIASSIRVGVEEALKRNASLESLLFLLSDQPFVTTGLIQELLDRHLAGDRPITACRYEQDVGVPAIFQKRFFRELQELTGDVGAKRIIARNRDEVEEVPFAKGHFDIDTVEDYEQLQDNDI